MNIKKCGIFIALYKSKQDKKWAADIALHASFPYHQVPQVDDVACTGKPGQNGKHDPYAVARPGEYSVTDKGRRAGDNTWRRAC